MNNRYCCPFLIFKIVFICSFFLCHSLEIYDQGNIFSNMSGLTPQTRKRKAEPERPVCIVCGDTAKRSTLLGSEKLEEFNLRFSNIFNKGLSTSSEVQLCSVHYTQWMQPPLIKCSVCSKKISKLYTRAPSKKILDVEPALSNTDLLCKPCYTKLGFRKLASEPQSKSVTLKNNDPNSVDDMLQIRKTELSDIISNFDKDGCLETLLVHKISVYVCDNLLSKSYINMKDMQTKMNTLAMKLCTNQAGNTLDIILNMPVLTLKNKIEKLLPGLFKYITSRQYGTLLVKTNCDIFSLFQRTLFELEKCKEENTSIRRIDSEDIHSVTEKKHDASSKSEQANTYEELALNFRTEIEKTNDNMSKVFSDIQLNQITLETIISTIGPKLFNFLFTLVASRSELNDYIKCKTTSHYTKFKNDTSFPKHIKFIRILFLVSQLVFIKSDGETVLPFHLLLADAVQAHGGSSKLIELLNRFGVVSSYDKCQREIYKKVKERLDLKLMYDFLPHGFAFVSADNIDIDQPFARIGDTHKAYT